MLCYDLVGIELIVAAAVLDASIGSVIGQSSEISTLNGISYRKFCEFPFEWCKSMNG